jgi:hypothetical protein
MGHTIKHNKEQHVPRETLVYGYSWVRYLLIPVLMFQVLYLYKFPNLGWTYVIITLLSICLFILFKYARKIKHDNTNLYLINASYEKVIPFSEIQSIKISNIKVYRSRYWKLSYLDETKDKHTIWFYSSFNHSFHDLVRKANPEVVIWTHPHFNR